VFAIMEDERNRQSSEVCLIASENYASLNVMTALGSELMNKYSEGQPGGRYYAGNENIDRLERLCQERALRLFGLDSGEWGVNVQPYSGSPANFAVYTALLEPHDRVMGLSLDSGGHLTHGFYTAKKRVSATSVYFESLPYSVDPNTGLIDYDELQRLALLFKPKLLIGGASAYPREIDWGRLREIADSVGAFLLADMAHISGLVAGGVAKPPFPFCDVVTSTTHKTLRGPRSGIIFMRKDLETRINEAVFPGLQGGPHNEKIGALAVALREADSEGFREYAQKVVANAQALARRLVEVHGCSLSTGGTDNHLVLWDVRKEGLTGSKVEKVLERCGLIANKNTVAGDKSAASPGGIRLGTPAMTTRGFGAAEFEWVGDLLVEGLGIAQKAQDACRERNGEGSSGVVKLREFVEVLEDPSLEFREQCEEVRRRVRETVEKFPLPSVHKRREVQCLQQKAAAEAPQQPS